MGQDAGHEVEERGGAIAVRQVIRRLVKQKKKLEDKERQGLVMYSDQEEEKTWVRK